MRQQNPFDSTIDAFTFKQLATKQTVATETALDAIEYIASQLRNQKDDLLRDKVEYRRFINVNYKKIPNFGRFFLIRPKGQQEYVGFLLCFDDLCALKPSDTTLDVHNRPDSEFPLDHCGNFLTHDIEFLQDLYYLREFAYVYQIGLLPAYQNQRGGQMLIEAFEHFYENCQEQDPEMQKPTLLAGALHERQYHVFQLLRHRQEQDSRYLFLDHYFDKRDKEQHWFRLVKLLEAEHFVRKLNPDLLSRAYHTIIPLQLNQAVKSVNRIIEQVDAKILWSSFFNTNELLRERFNLREDNHGFFGVLLEACEREHYHRILDELRKITVYLESKNRNGKQVPSLTRLLDKQNTEIYFFSEGASGHRLNRYTNTCVFDIGDEEGMLDKFFRHLRKHSSEDFRTLDESSKTEWWISLQKFAKLGADTLADVRLKTISDWREWKSMLEIDEQEEQMLVQGVILLKAGTQRELNKAEQQQVQQYRKQLRKINKRRVIERKRYQAWREYLSLHPRMYRIDASTVENSEDYWWCHAIIPINYADGRNVSGIMFAFRCKKLPKEHPDYHHRMAHLSELISSALSKNILNILIKLQQKATNEMAYRYATAGVLSRNLAHNFGSHILTRLDQEETLRRMREGMSEGKFDQDMSQFIRYMRIRTNLLSDMSTSEPTSTNGMWLGKELIDAMDEQRVLKKYISNSKLENIKIRYYYKSSESRKDIKVQVPNGDLGVSAMYMIIENVIRNSAKHEHEQLAQRSELTITVDMVEEKDRGYEIAIYDDIARDPYELDQLVYKINRRYIQKKVIDQRNQIRGSAWGILEMRAAASYLRKKVPGITLGEEQNRKVPLLVAQTKDIPLNGKAGKTLSYHIYLKKPRLLVLVDLGHLISEDVAQQVQARGEVRLYRDYGGMRESKTTFSHQFAIYFRSQDRQELSAQKRFPLRWIPIDSLEDQTELYQLLYDKTDSEFLQLWLWGRWLGKYCLDKRIPEVSDLELYTPALNGQDAAELEIGSPPERTLLFDDHGDWADKHPGYDLDELSFYAYHKSNCKFGTYQASVESLKEQHHKEIFRSELREAALTEIVVLDERIQEYGLQGRFDEIKDYFQALRRMNVYLPDPKIGEPDLAGGCSPQELAAWIEDILLHKKIDFLVLHLGLIESLLSSEMQKVEDWLQKHVSRVSYKTEVVLVSGRGKPHGLPKGMCYQPYDSIAQHMLDRIPSKYHLVQTLFSSRTRMGI